MPGRKPDLADGARAAAACLLLVLILGCGSRKTALEQPGGDSSTAWPEPASNESPGHQLMVTELAEIAKRTPDENIWLGDKRARDLREKLAALPADAPVATIGQLKTDLAKAELRLGNEQVAIDLLLECERKHIPAIVKGWSERDALKLVNAVRFNLGIAFLRKGEADNCCQRNTPDSCIMPIRGTGIHAIEDGSRNAILCFSAVLDHSEGNTEDRLRARWLLNIAYMTVGGYPHEVPAEYLIPLDKLMPEGGSVPRFRNIAGNIGLGTFSLSGGVIADDFDNDGYIDLVVSSYDSGEQVRLFNNNTDGTFTERSADAGLTGIVGGLNLVQADFDNDGWTDILVLRGAWLGGNGQHPNSLLRNDGVPGVAQFTDVTYSSGLGDANSPTQTAAWADYDNDGDLDLYVGNETMPGGREFPCQLFRNNGDGTFTDQALAAGVTNGRFTKAVVWGDYDSDRFPDIYVSNFEGENRLYHNNGDGTFTDRAPELGVTGPHESFPTWFWDFDNDGQLDIYASGYFGDIASLAADALALPHKSEQTSLYRGTGDGRFTDVAKEVGLTRPTAPMGSNFGDLDGDGFQDFYLGTGEPKFMNLMPNLMFLNRGGKQFVDVTRASGLGHLQKGHAVAFADIDNDGDVDIFEQMGGGYAGDPFFDALFENPGPAQHWITLKLTGTKSNRSAIGARIRIDAGGRSIYRWVNSGGSFGANPLRQHIGIGAATAIDKLEVYWPTSDTTQQWDDAPLDRFYEITEGTQELKEIELESLQLSAP